MTDIPFYVSEDKSALVVAQDTRVQWTYRGHVFKRTLPEGHEFCPGVGQVTVRFLRAFAPPFALHNASALHDYLYDEMEERPGQAVARAVADAALKADPQDPAWLGTLAWAIVRVVGVFPWLGRETE